MAVGGTTFDGETAFQTAAFCRGHGLGRNVGSSAVLGDSRNDVARLFAGRRVPLVETPRSFPAKWFVKNVCVQLAQALRDFAALKARRFSNAAKPFDATRLVMFADHFLTNQNHCLRYSKQTAIYCRLTVN